MQRRNVSVRTQLCIHFGACPRGLLRQIYTGFTQRPHQWLTAGDWARVA
jgi:hypothetical protein